MSKAKTQLQKACVCRVKHRLSSLTESAGTVPVELDYVELNHIINALSYYGSNPKFPGLSPAGIMKKLRMAFHQASEKQTETGYAGRSYAGRNPDASFQ